MEKEKEFDNKELIVKKLSITNKWLKHINSNKKQLIVTIILFDSR